jgi:hypothetical protein
MENNQISTSSTTSNLNNNQSLEEKEYKMRNEHPTFVLLNNRKYKNLVHCYACKIEDCQKLFKTYQELIEHKKEHIKIFICPIDECNKNFTDIINLKKHLKHHFPTKKKYYCPYKGCGKSFTASYNLNIHYRIHIGNRPYKCLKCGESFFDRANYKYHISTKHVNVNLKKLTCQHKNCNHKSKSIRQKLMHHDKLEEFCIKEKNLLLNLLMTFQKSTVCLLKSETETKNEIVNNFNLKDNELINEIKRIDLDSDLKNDFKNILLQSKILCSKAIDQSLYKDLIDDCN